MHVNVRKLVVAMVLAAVVVSTASPALAFPATAFDDWATIELSHPWAHGYVALAAALEIMKGFDRGDVPIDPGNGQPPVLYRDLYERYKDDPDPLNDVIRSMPPTYPGTDGLLAPREFAIKVPFTRAQAAAAVARVGFGVFGGTVPLRPGVPAFADVDDAAWYAPYVHTLQNEGIIDMVQHRQGEAYRFEPERPITRGELAAWIGAVLRRLDVTPEDLKNVQPMRWVNPQHAHRWVGKWDEIPWEWVEIPQPGDMPPTFTDLPVGYPGYENIRYAAQLGVVSGYDEGGNRVFRPAQPVTRLEAAKMLVVLANLLTDDPPTVEELVEISNKAAIIEGTLDDQIGPEMTYREIYDQTAQSELPKYVTWDGLFADGGSVSGAWSGRKLPRSGGRHRIVAARPVFLGTRFAVLDAVDAVTNRLMPGTSYYGKMLFYVRDQEGWKESDMLGPGALPAWWTKDHCDEFGRCRE